MDRERALGMIKDRVKNKNLVKHMLAVEAIMREVAAKKGGDTQFIMNRFNEKHFAAGANRDQIKTCDKFEMPLDEFIGTALNGMQKIAGELGL